jgi:hypothetical protein
MKSPAILDFLTMVRTVNIYIQLFLTFAKIGVCTFGGGYAMLPILQREVVENRHWATDEDLNDYFAIGQCTPSIIAVNTATFFWGGKTQGNLGGNMCHPRTRISQPCHHCHDCRRTESVSGQSLCDTCF